MKLYKFHYVLRQHGNGAISASPMIVARTFEEAVAIGIDAYNRTQSEEEVTGQTFGSSGSSLSLTLEEFVDLDTCLHREQQE